MYNCSDQLFDGYAIILVFGSAVTCRYWSLFYDCDCSYAKTCHYMQASAVIISAK